ncbi:2977_t:CDS:2 [Ambispora leptoticha]|uniref:2977_t:CDS:1 n=1 Tax=Ambispora leptoticha TaxID=144679 RepID=A0A9N8ZD08_9GLOM|nr:2977_t:CDS:2 [Ambispora leptoticha]
MSKLNEMYMYNIWYERECDDLMQIRTTCIAKICSVFDNNDHNVLYHSYSVNEIATRLDELHQTGQQYNIPTNIWFNFVEGSDFSVLNGINILFDPDPSFASNIQIIEVEFIPDLQPNNHPTIDNEMLQTGGDILSTTYIVSN